MNPQRKFRLHRFAWVIALAFIAGCSSLPPEEQARRDRVLNENREALTHLRAGNYAAARPLLDDVVTTLGGVTAGDRSAREARSYFKEESRKNFRGEPYERVMAYYYRGILYWMDGEPDNARACFRVPRCFLWLEQDWGGLTPSGSHPPRKCFRRLWSP